MPKHTCLIIATFLGSVIAYPLYAQETIAITPPQVELRLQQQISVTWRGQQLGTIIQRLSDTQGIAIWLDRRVDPQQTVELRLTDVSLAHALEAITEKLGLGFSVLESVVYVGPAASARELQTLSRRSHERLAKVPTAMKKRWLRITPWECPRLSNPRMLLAEMLRDAKIKLTGEKLVPHDLWLAKQLPPTSLVDRVVLILIGFDLTCNISADGKMCEVVPIQRPIVLERKYKRPRNRQAPPRKPSSRPTRKAEKKFSLQLQNQPVGAVIGQLAKQLKFDVVWDEASLVANGISRDDLVSCRVRNVDFDELLTSILSPAGLQFQRNGNSIEIKAGE
ncbi:MAG: hypothetical protein GXP26_09815 [Planctomycetes bacterium]|nr:hypothetical protein [Planctomycetota bacterium]